MSSAVSKGQGQGKGKQKGKGKKPPSETHRVKQDRKTRPPPGSACAEKPAGLAAFL